MARYRALLSYEGTAYVGFQRQAGDAPTIQLAVERAVAEATGQPTTVLGAGRTDTGVHATGQVIAFNVEWAHGEAELTRAVNARLPDDIALWAVAQHEGFHPRFDALSRTYRYTVALAPYRLPLLRHRAWQLRASLDGEAMQEAAGELIGKRDFAAFGQPPQGENTVRTVLSSEWAKAERPGYTEWVYTIEADAFLKHMVRRITGALVDVGRGALSLDEFRALRDRAKLRAKGSIAPPHGLVLEYVRYPHQGDTPFWASSKAGETPAGG
ncbi:MAG: tRNA pseudouridine(38-40) synthase TruA [Anaerolineae bacterium]